MSLDMVDGEEPRVAVQDSGSSPLAYRHFVVLAAID